MKFKQAFEFVSRILLNPWTSLVTMSIGVLTGMYFKTFAISLHSYGQSYLSLLSMCVYPVLLTAIATSVAGLVRSGHGGRRLEIMAAVLGGFILCASAMGVLAGEIFTPGVIDDEGAKTKMASIIDNNTGYSTLCIDYASDEVASEKRYGVARFLKDAISPNIFESLAMNRSLQVLFFSIVLGVSLGSLKPQHSDTGIAALESFYHAFIKIIKWAMYPLSIGLFCLVASEVAKVGSDVVLSMAAFLIVFHIAAFVFIMLGATLIWWKSRRGFWRSFFILKEPLIIALGTRNSLAALPAAIEASIEGFRLKEDGPRLLLPLGITIGRFGNAMYFALAGVFVAQLYEVPLGVESICAIVFCGALAGMATSGASGAVTLTMLMMVLEPLRIPWEAALALFIAVDTLAEPVRTMLTVHSSCAFAALLSEREPRKSSSSEVQARASRKENPGSDVANPAPQPG